MKPQKSLTLRVSLPQDAANDLMQRALESSVWILRIHGGVSRRRVSIEELVIAQILSRELDTYVVLSPAARAAAQLRKAGKEIQPGQRIRFVYTRGKPRVAEWDLADLPSQEQLDCEHYRTLALRAVHTVLQPFGITEAMLENWLLSKAGFGAPVGKSGRTSELGPLFTELEPIQKSIEALFSEKTLIKRGSSP